MIELPKQINAILLKTFGWSHEDIAALKEKYDKSIDKTKFLETVNVITDYKLRYEDIEHFDLEHDKDDVHHKAIESKVLIKTPEKTEDNVIQEVKDWNKHKDKEIQKVIDVYKKIKKNYASSSISKFDKEKFKTLPKNFFTSCSDDDAYNYIIKTIKLTKDYEPRSIQLIAALLLIEKNSSMNRILQILTGEGKTIIISIIAAYLVHKKHKVDIITSSEVLANQSYNETVEFFNLLNITVASNCENQADVLKRKPKKDIYSVDVVYGTSHSFEADILSDEYEKTGIRNERPFDSVIVDEIDNMFIDNHSGQTLLSSQTPFFERINFVFYYIWSILKDWTDPSKITDYTKQVMEDMLMALINNSDGDNQSLSANYLPTYLKQLIKQQAKLWITNAINSKFHFKEGIDYVINKERTNILPVDSSNTGVVQTNSQYSDGIHQFLLIKHNLKMIPYSLTTNFSSNVGLFKRYGKNNKIYGLTGTIGTKNSQDLLNTIYNIDFLKIPPFKTRILYELSHRICAGETFLKNIGEVVQRETKNGRPILIICPDIQTGENIYNYLSQYIIHDKDKLVKYFRNDIDKIELDKEDVTFGKVYVSTNLSGRGTDLKIKKELEKKGGLHVCITFMPKNQRVEEQAYGRSGRKGQPGTWQLILPTSEFHADESQIISIWEDTKDMNEKILSTPELTIKFDNLALTVNQLYKFRDEREEEESKNILKNVDDIVNQDELFEKFCKFLKDTPEAKEGDCPIRKNIEERWAVWLLSNKNVKDKKELFTNFDLFIQEIKDDIKSGKVVQNPTYLNKRANEEICKNLFDENNQKGSLRIIGEWIGGWFEKKKEPNYSYAKEILTQSIKRFNCSFIPYYLRGICYACQQCPSNAITDLKKASELIIEEAFSTHFIKMAVMQEEKQSSIFLLYQNINDQIIEQNINQLKILKPDKILVQKLEITELFKETLVQSELNELKSNGLEYVFIIKQKKTFLDNIGYFFLGATQIVFGCLAGPLCPIGALLLSSGINDVINSISDSIRGVSPPFKKYCEEKYDKYLKPTLTIVSSSFVVSRLQKCGFLDFTISEMFQKLGRSDSRLGEEYFAGNNLGVNFEGTVDDNLNRFGIAYKKIHEIIKGATIAKSYVMTMLEAFLPRNEYEQRTLNSVNVDNEKMLYQYNKKRTEQNLALMTKMLNLEQKNKEELFKAQKEKQKKQLDELKRQKKQLIQQATRRIEEINRNQPHISNIRAILNLDNSNTQTVRILQERLRNLSNSELLNRRENTFRFQSIEGINEGDITREFLQNLENYAQHIADLENRDLRSTMPFVISICTENLQKNFRDLANTISENETNLVNQYNQNVSELNKIKEEYKEFFEKENKDLSDRQKVIKDKQEQFKKVKESCEYMYNNYQNLLKEVVENQYKDKYDPIITDILNCLKSRCNPTRIDQKLVDEFSNLIKEKITSLQDEINQLIEDNNSAVENFEQKCEQWTTKIQDKEDRLKPEKQKLEETQKQNKDTIEKINKADLTSVSTDIVNGNVIDFQNDQLNQAVQNFIDVVNEQQQIDNERTVTYVYQMTKKNISNNPINLPQNETINLNSSFITERNKDKYKYNYRDIINIVNSIISDVNGNNKYAFAFEEEPINPEAEIIIGMFNKKSNKNGIVFLINKINRQLYYVDYNQEQTSDFKSFIDKLNLGELTWKLNNKKEESQSIAEHDKNVIALKQIYDIINEFEKSTQEEFDNIFPTMELCITDEDELLGLRQCTFPTLYLKYIIADMEKEGLVDYTKKNKNPYGILITKLSNNENENNQIDNLIGENIREAVNNDTRKFNQWRTWKTQFRNNLRQ